MTMTRTPCAVLMDFMPVWRILAFVFCCTRLMGFSRIPTCSSRCCRAKLWMLGRVGREWRSSATPSSGSGSKRSTRQPRASPPPQALKETLAHITPQKVLDNVICQIENRFQDQDKLTFLSLLDPQQFPDYQKKVPQTAYSSLGQSYGTLFDLPRLKTELAVMYSMTHLKGKVPAELLGFLHRKDLGESMGQLYALACLAVTIPGSAASERSVSALQRIKSYANKTSGQRRVPPLASMAIEKNLLAELKGAWLYDRVIERFAGKEGIDFVYK